jgi:FkbM family methyltransferase
VRDPARESVTYDAPAAQQPPFGSYSPTLLQSLIIGMAAHTILGRGRARWIMSDVLARLRPGPLDVTRFGMKQRLHHYGPHLFEKKMLLDVRRHDTDELTFLRNALRPGFRFVDIGSNVGLYVMAVKSWAPDAKILAVEVDPTYANRLEFNVAANGLRNVSVVNAAAGASSGTGKYYIDVGSMIGSGRSVEVPVKTLLDMLVADGFDRVDAMKVDIEGFEGRVLPPFFDTAPRSLWPRLLILEAWTDAVCGLCIEQGYRVRMQAPHMNTILELADA